jgi:hypothetical protein
MTSLSTVSLERADGGRYGGRVRIGMRGRFRRKPHFKRKIKID